MPIFLKGRRSKHHLRSILLGILFAQVVFSSSILNVCADPVDTETQIINDSHTIRIPDFIQSCSSTLTHTHVGNAQTKGICYSIPVLHHHTGSETEGGGCYVPVYHTHNGSCYRSETCEVSPQSWDIIDYGDTYCSYHGQTTYVTYNVTLSHSDCGLGITSAPQGGNCIQCGGNVYSYSHSYSYLICGKGSDYIDSYKLGCNKTAGEAIDYYDLGCGLDEKGYGSITLTNSSPQWTAGNVTLTGILYDPESVICRDNHGVLSYEAIEGSIKDFLDNGITVSENGCYKLSVDVNENHFSSPDTSITLTVSNIDRTEPQITSISYDTKNEWVLSNTITVEATDLQPDSTPGSGLSETPYSFDGGQTWQSENSYECTSNGVYEIQVRDYCGNIQKDYIEINNIDCTPPVVEISASPSIWYPDEEPRTFTITAYDLQSGLSENAYLYGDSKQWVSSNIISREIPGDFQISVRDALGNITTLTQENLASVREPNSNMIDDNSDDYAPIISDPPLSPIPANDESKISIDVCNNDENDTPNSDLTIWPTSTKNTDTISVIPYTGIDLTKNIPDKTIYIEQIPSLNSTRNVNSSDDTLHIPFYKTTAFKVAASAAGGSSGIGLFLLLFLFLHSGVRVMNYDSKKYRLLGILPIHRSARGLYINISESMIARSYSGKYKFILGYFFVKKHKNDLIYIHVDNKWIALHVDKCVYQSISNVRS